MESMTEMLLAAVVVLLIVVIAVVVMTWRAAGRVDQVTQSVAQLDRVMREEMSRTRIESGQQSASLRTEVQSTLDKRLGESFKAVSERLEQVHKGLGEMQSLATGVGDLKKVLTNVKTRGTWGEVQLGALLEQVLAPEQYEKNVATKGGGERVEFAVKLPGADKDKGPVWLPIDAKFPMEDYQRLLEAWDRADTAAAELAGRQLENALRVNAKAISDKYVLPPATTDFGILFLPVEGLYAEALRRPGLADALQRDFRVTLAGPSTLWALLNSLQMGFRTLVIEKRSSEVWELLGVVRTEFGRYSEALAKVKKKLEETGAAIDQAEVRTRAIQRKLRNVESGEGEQMAIED
jgi:DNA recombination protein RmuC